MWTGAIVATALGAVVGCAILSRKVITSDPFAFGIAARRLLDGQRLYVDFFESKPPLATLFYAIPGAIGPRSYLAVCWSLAGLLLAQAALWLWQVRPRLLTATACLLFVVLYPISCEEFGWTSTEHISNLFVTMVLLLALAMFHDNRLSWWRCLLAGAAACAAFHCRQNAVVCIFVPLAVCALAEAARTARLSAVLWLGLGGIIAWGAIVGLVCSISSPASYFFQTFVFPLRFAEVGGNGQRYALLATMGGHSLAALGALAAGLALAGTYRSLALVVLPVGVLVCLLSPRPYACYWVNFFPFATMCLLMGLPRDDPKTPSLERLSLAVIATCVLAGMLRLYPIARSPSEIEPMDEVANWIDEHAGQDDTLYVSTPLDGDYIGSEYIQFRSKLLPANKYTIGWEIDVNDGMMADSFEDIFRSYLQHPPTILVVRGRELAAIDKARSPGLGDMLLSTRITLELMNAYQYDRVKELHGFHIHVLRGVAERAEDRK